MTAWARILTALLLAAAAAVSACPAAWAEDDDGRQDIRMGNPDRTRSGVNERGDNEMVIEKKPKRQQQMPDMGGMIVVPQVNGRGGTTIVPVPVAPGQQGQRQPPAQQQGHP